MHKGSNFLQLCLLRFVKLFLNKQNLRKNSCLLLFEIQAEEKPTNLPTVLLVPQRLYRV